MNRHTDWQAVPDHPQIDEGRDRQHHLKKNCSFFHIVKVEIHFFPDEDAPNCIAHLIISSSTVVFRL